MSCGFPVRGSRCEACGTTQDARQPDGADEGPAPRVQRHAYASLADADVAGLERVTEAFRAKDLSRVVELLLAGESGVPPQSALPGAASDGPGWIATVRGAPVFVALRTAADEIVIEALVARLPGSRRLPALRLALELCAHEAASSRVCLRGDLLVLRFGARLSLVTPPVLRHYLREIGHLASRYAGLLTVSLDALPALADDARPTGFEALGHTRKIQLGTGGSIRRSIPPPSASDSGAGAANGASAPEARSKPRAQEELSSPPPTPRQAVPAAPAPPPTPRQVVLTPPPVPRQAVGAMPAPSPTPRPVVPPPPPVPQVRPRMPAGARPLPRDEEDSAAPVEVSRHTPSRPLTDSSELGGGDAIPAVLSPMFSAAAVSGAAASRRVSVPTPADPRPSLRPEVEPAKSRPVVEPAGGDKTAALDAGLSPSDRLCMLLRHAQSLASLTLEERPATMGWLVRSAVFRAIYDFKDLLPDAIAHLYRCTGVGKDLPPTGAAAGARSSSGQMPATEPALVVMERVIVARAQVQKEKPLAIEPMTSAAQAKEHVARYLLEIDRAPGDPPLRHFLALGALTELLVRTKLPAQTDQRLRDIVAHAQREGAKNQAIELMMTALQRINS